jgi:hypothetical protein
MAIYRKKPIEVEAVQWTGENTDEVKDFVGMTEFDKPGFVTYADLLELFPDIPGAGMSPEKPEGSPDAYVYDKLHSNVGVKVGDWIIKGVQGEFYPCKPDVFIETYDSI